MLIATSSWGTWALGQFHSNCRSFYYVQFLITLQTINTGKYIVIIILIFLLSNRLRSFSNEMFLFISGRILGHLIESLAYWVACDQKYLGLG